MRVIQPIGTRGSLKWLQLAVNNRPELLNAIVPTLGKIKWLSPLRDDDLAEYRDGAFLGLIGCSHLYEELANFWPKRGPQWDALARTDQGEVLIVEAKAHIAELFSPPSAAASVSRTMIDVALLETSRYLSVKSASAWGSHFYQLTNRLAHLMFLRAHHVNARLVLLNFIGDVEMKGPSCDAEWEAAYAVVDHVLGLPKHHKLSKHISHASIDVDLLVG